MTYRWLETDLWDEPHPADLPELVHLSRAVEIGGEGGSLTLLGPHEEKASSRLW